LMKGKLEAFGSFRDVLAEAMVAGLPELRKDVIDVVIKTRGREEVVEKEEKAS
jgi:mediator of RNA polymerase II transcription subunit 10